MVLSEIRARRAGLGPEELDRLAGLAYFRIGVHLATFRGASQEELIVWVRRLTRSVVADDARKRCRRTALLDSLRERDRSGSARADPIQEADRRDEVETLLSHLRSDEQEIVSLHYLDELSHVDIAERLGLTPRAVGHRIRRAIQKLRSSHGLGLDRQP